MRTNFGRLHEDYLYNWWLSNQTILIPFLNTEIGPAKT